jgi:hypothetical protein
MGGKKKPTIGYWYYFAVHWGWSVAADALLEIRGGDKPAWQGRTGSGRISINAPNLYGGEKAEGGIVSDFDVQMGEQTQAPNSYLASVFGSQQSAYRGKATGVFRGGKMGALNPYPKPLSFKLEGIFSGWQDDTCWYPEKAAIAMSVGADGDGYFLVRAGAQYGNTSVIYGTVGADYIDTAANIGRNCIAARNASTGSTFTYGGSYVYDAGTGPEIAAWSTELGITIGIAGIRVVPTCPIGGTVSYVEHDPATPLGVGNPTIVCSGISALNGMNPAHILYDSINNTMTGQGEPSALINDASLRAAADKLFAEGFGLCTTYEGQESIEAFQQRICDVIGGNLTQSRVDGQYYLDLIRGDYVFGDLPILTEDDILVFEQDPSVASEQINQVLVDWFDPQTKQQRTTAPVRALGSIQLSGAISQTQSYPEIPTELLALRCASRDLKARSTPLSRFNLITTRKLYAMRPGLPFRLQMPSEGIADMVVWIGEIGAGTSIDSKMTIKCVQDVFSFPSTVYVGTEAGMGAPTDQTPHAPTHQIAFEAPYLELAGVLSTADLAALGATSGYLDMAAARPSGTALNYSIATAAAGEAYVDRGTADWCPIATIVEAALQGASSFTLASAADLDLVVVGTAALWDGEIVRVNAIDALALTITLGRGCADTVPVAHAAGQLIYFYDQYNGSDQREYIDGELVHAKLLTRTTSQELLLGDATAIDVTMASRQARPYPPANAKINGVLWPTALSGAIVTTYDHRDRILQADNLVVWGEVSIGPEVGTTYTQRIFVDGTLLDTQTALAGNPASFTPSINGTIRIEIEAHRAGLTSWQMVVIQCPYTAPLAPMHASPVTAVSAALRTAVAVSTHRKEHSHDR